MYFKPIENDGNELFQNGNSEFLAAVLNEEFKYKIMVLMSFKEDPQYYDSDLARLSYDENLERLAPLRRGDKFGYVEPQHCFCFFEDNGKTYYVDSLGITDNINDILRNFDTNTDKTPIYKDLDDVGEYGGSKYESVLVEFSSIDEIRGCHWSAYYDWMYAENFKDELYTFRIKPSIDFVEKYKDQLVLNEHRTLTSAQKDYFKDSKVRDRNGDLIEVYHGSKSKGFDEFQYSPDRQTGTDFGEAYYFTTDYDSARAYTYDQLKDPRLQIIRAKRNALVRKSEETGDLSYLKEISNLRDERGRTEDEIAAAADYYTGGEVHSVYLDIKNPYVAFAGGKPYYDVYEQFFKDAKSGGYDGIIVHNVSDTAIGETRPTDVYIAFSPNQIKAVDNAYPTKSNNFKDNSKDYLKENSHKISTQEHIKISKYIAEKENRYTKAKNIGRDQTRDFDRE